MYKYLLGFMFSVSLMAQTGPLNQLKVAKSQSLLKNYSVKNIGPTVMSGRVVDLAVNPENPAEFYVAYASGGLWHTTSNGLDFTPVLDSASTQNIGDIAVHWGSRTIYVGTGENNSSRSSYAGIGIIKSEDQGKTWEHVGLSDSHHIGRIKVNPNNKNELVVGVTGHLYTPNLVRGIYKSIDGGKTWKQTLFVDSKTGIIDVQTSPTNFNIMYASSWTKMRKAWNFSGSGKGSAIYKSTDAGSTWSKVTTPTSGFSTGDTVGRIGLAVYNDDVIYAIHDSQKRVVKPVSSTKKVKGLTKDDFRTLSVEAFANLSNKELNAYLKNNRFDSKYNAKRVKNLVASGELKPVDFVNYLEDKTKVVYDNPLRGAELYKSIDGGKTWQDAHDGPILNIFFHYGYYFSQMRVDPSNQDRIFILGNLLLESTDGGKNFKSISRGNLHADQHALWVNPSNPKHLINGNDGGANVTFNGGESWFKNNTNAVGQFYTVQVDNEPVYNVYGGLQDNGVWMAPNNAPINNTWQQKGVNPWGKIMGGDGMYIQVDKRDKNIVYTGYQFGNYYRLNLATKERKYIKPKHSLGESPYRFNWVTPILLSDYHQDVLYFGGNKLMRSLNQGNSWEPISPDLTKGGELGNVAFGTITSISESAFSMGRLAVGTDDGLVHVTKDGGFAWTNISKGLPEGLWVSRVRLSKYNKDRIYVALNGYRNDDFKTYIYVSEDFGATWKSISGNIADSPVNVILEDSENENLLFLGTDNGAYASFDNGASWNLFVKDFPSVAVHDMVIQEREKDLLIATHGRSIYKVDIAALQELSNSNLNTSLKLFNVPNVNKVDYWGGFWKEWNPVKDGKLTINFYASKASQLTLKIKTASGKELNSFAINAEKGINQFDYNLTMTEKGMKFWNRKHSDKKVYKSEQGGIYLARGIYTVQIGGQEKQFEVK